MTGLPADVAVEAVPGGVELRAVTVDGQAVTLWFDDSTGLVLADRLTMVCERPVRVVAA